MADRSDRLQKVRQDILAMETDGYLGPVVANGVLGLLWVPSTDINFLEDLAGRFKRSQEQEHESRRRGLLFLMSNWTSKMVSVPREEETQTPGKSLYLLGYRTIGDTCSIVDEECAKLAKWKESGSLGERPPTPALDVLDDLCTQLELNSNSMIEMFKINRDRNSIAHPPAPELKATSTAAEIAAFQGFAEEKKSEVEQLAKEKVIDQKTRETFCNIIEQCRSFEVRGVKKGGARGMGKSRRGG